MTTKEEIDDWFEHGRKRRATHMLVVCDTFDHEDYPVFAMTPADCLAKYKSPGVMQRVMEVYDLDADKASQLRETRAMHLPGA